MSRFTFWQKWLLVVSSGITVFGLFMALASGTALFDLFNRLIDPSFDTTGVVLVPGYLQFKHWVYGVWGATIAGWGAFLIFIVYYPFSRKEKWAWNCLAAGLLLWYVFDTALSFAYGVSFNVFFNSVLILLVGIPLLATRKGFNP